MPIRKKWSPATTEHIVRNVPEKGGVYELNSFGKLVYIGKAKNLRERLLTHNRERDPNKYRFKKAGLFTRPKSLEDKHLSNYEDRYGGIPPWNKRDTRDRW